jgi:hypothetical protein
MLIKELTPEIENSIVPVDVSPLVKAVENMSTLSRTDKNTFKRFLKQGRGKAVAELQLSVGEYELIMDNPEIREMLISYKEMVITNVRQIILDNAHLLTDTLLRLALNGDRSAIKDCFELIGLTTVASNNANVATQANQNVQIQVNLSAHRGEIENEDIIEGG